MVVETECSHSPLSFLVEAGISAGFLRCMLYNNMTRLAQLHPFLDIRIVLFHEKYSSDKADIAMD